jgi:glycosyltransferase involved in cell wall biosynthesis
VRIKIDPLAILEMRKHFRAQKADIVHTHLSTSSVNGTLAARLARVPCISTVHGMSGKLSYVFADHMIGVSQGVCDHLVQQGVARDKVTAVYNGVQLPKNHLSKSESREKFGIPSDALVIGTVARLTAMKGLDFSLTAFQTIAQQVPHAHYVLVGDGDDRARYEQMVKEFGIAERVHFLGYQDPVFDPLATMDLFLFPSLKEAMGIAVVEAMSLGMPVVSTNVGGLPEVIDASMGRLVNPSDADALARECLDLIQRGDLASLGLAARVKAESMFSVEAMRLGTDAVYHELLSR